MGSILRKLKRTVSPVKNKCCGRHMVLKEVPSETVTDSGEIVKTVKKAYVCEQCGKGVYLDGKMDHFIGIPKRKK